LIRITHILFGVICMLSCVSYAQDNIPASDPDVSDTLQNPIHPYRKAMLYSAILPGAGQIYNHRLLPKTSRRKWNVYWKVPLIYGALGTSIFMLGQKQKQINSLKNEYNFRVENNVLYNDINFQGFDNQAIIQLHNISQTQRDLFILTSVLIYAINVIDASVEAHFINFDVSSDLTMQVYPTTLTGFRPGLGIALRFK